MNIHQGVIACLNIHEEVYIMFEYPLRRYSTFKYPQRRYSMSKYPLSRYSFFKYPMTRYSMSEYPLMEEVSSMEEVCLNPNWLWHGLSARQTESRKCSEDEDYDCMSLLDTSIDPKAAASTILFRLSVLYQNYYSFTQRRVVYTHVYPSQ